MRIATLLSCATEIACALGHTRSLVARSHECDFPLEITHLPVVTKSKIDSSLDSAYIDEQVRKLSTNGESVYEIDSGVLLECKPDFIITQKQCEVCAVSYDEVQKSISNWEQKPHIIAINPRNLDDIFSEIFLIGTELGSQSKANQLIEQSYTRLSRIKYTLANYSRPTVVFVEWISPLMIGANWIPEVVEIGGGIPLGTVHGKQTDYSSGDALYELNPDYIVIGPCGFTIDQSLRDLHFLTQNINWDSLSAVKNGRVYIADGNFYFNRSGPRIIDSIELLTYILHGNLFPEFNYFNTYIHKLY